MPDSSSSKVKKRANQYDAKEKDHLYNPLGQRLLDAMRSAGFTGPHEFAIRAFGPGSRKGNLSAQLKRLTADNPDASMMANQLVAYAKAARVSLHWLITGEGGKTLQPYGQLTGEEMQAIPEELARATRALMELDNLSPVVAMDLAERVLKQRGRGYLRPDEWLTRMRVVLQDTGEGAASDSGLRPSQRIKAASPIND